MERRSSWSDEPSCSREQVISAGKKVLKKVPGVKPEDSPQRQLAAPARGQ